MNRQLRDYQQEALTNIKLSIGQGVRRIVMMAPTGAGKTLLAAAMVEGAQRKGNRLAFVVPSIQLIDQTVEKFYAEGIRDIGVIQANHEMTDWSKPVQVCSVQTLKSRQAYPEAKIVVIDECHALHAFHQQWLMHPDWQNVPFIGLSATPYTKGLGKYFHSLLIAATTKELIDKGLLSPFTVFACPKADLSDVKVVGGDYVKHQLSGAMQHGTLTADIVRTWKERWGKDKTLVFAVDRAHAETLHFRFMEAGVRSAYQDANTSSADRHEIERGFHDGRYQVVCNVGTLCLDQQTEILTDQGWVGIDGMTYEHRVAAWSEDGTEFAHPLHIVRRHRDVHEKMVSVEGRIHNIRVTGNHRMLWSKSPRGFKISPAESLVGLSGFIPVSGQAAPKVIERPAADANRNRLRRNGLTYKYRTLGMTAAQAIEAEQEHRDHLAQHCALKLPHELSLDECGFIGFWIGDGTRSGGRFMVAQSRRYPKIIAWFDNLVARIGLHITRSVYAPSTKSSNESIRWNFSTGRGGRGQRIVAGLAPIMPYLDKDGSELLWGLNTEQFGAFLHGYWLADGNHGDGNGDGRGKRISGRSLSLFNLLQAIGACRGYRISIKKDNAKHRRAPFYRITWQRLAASRLVRERFKLEDDFRLERVWCVTSTTGNIITRRAGKVAVVGNTTGVDWNVHCLVLARPTKSEILYVQIIGRALRTAPGKERALILDHSDTTQELGFVTDIHHDHLDMGKKKTAKEVADKPRKTLPRACPQCASIQPRLNRTCQQCGFKLPLMSGVVERDGVLVELVPGQVHRNGGKREYSMVEKEDFYAQLLGYAREHDYKHGWAANKYREKFGVWPNRMRHVQPDEPSFEVASWIRSRNIAWSKSKRRKRKPTPSTRRWGGENIPHGPNRGA
jgi:superfamily II DNA or RNA helicase